MIKRLMDQLTTSKAALIVGVAFITSVIIVTIVDDLLLANFVVPGDSVALARDIEAMGSQFGLAVVGYLIVLMLDSTIALALYVVLKPASTYLAQLTAALRILYAGIVAVGIILLALGWLDVNGYEVIKKGGYVFFAVHIFTLGLTILKSEYIPKYLGFLLLLASFTYGVFFVELDLSESLKVILMSTMAMAELSLSIWLIVRRKHLPNI